MPSSISSSKDRVPRDPGGRSMIVAVVLFAVTFCGVEMFWRLQGHGASVVDDPAWWAYHRASIYEGNPKTIVLLGGSRMQLDFSTEVARKRLPEWHVVQLAIDGRGPVAALRDLADDQAFVGVVICAVTAPILARDKWDDQQEYVEYYRRNHEISLNSKLNRVISSHIQSNLVAVNPWVSSRRVIGRLLRREGLPPPHYLTTHYDRSRSADYAKLDIAAHRQRRIDKFFQSVKRKTPPLPEEWLDELAPIEKAVQSIQIRGGRVVFVRFPTTGERFLRGERYMPRRHYWDRFAERTAGCTIHFLDVPALADFECPDNSHIDLRDKPRFTNALLDELVRRGVISARAIRRP